MTPVRMTNGLRQEIVWVSYAVANDSSFLAGVVRYAYQQTCSTRGIVSLQWLLIMCEAARHACVATKNWEEADRAERLYRRARKIEKRLVWRKRDQALEEAKAQAKLGA